MLLLLLTLITVFRDWLSLLSLLAVTVFEFDGLAGLSLAFIFLAAKSRDAIKEKGGSSSSMADDLCVVADFTTFGCEGD